MTAQGTGASYQQQEQRGRPLLAKGIAILLFLFGFFPIANWIGGGHEAPWYGDVLQSWLAGTAIVAGVAVVLIVLTRRRLLDVAHAVSLASGEWFRRKPLLSATVLACVAGVVYASAALLVFDGRPLFIDEIVQLYQARIFAAGRLADPVGPFPEFFGALNVVSVGDRQFGQFPPGGPAHLLLGVWLQAPWLITPLTGACTVFVFAWLVRHFEPDPAIALAAVLLLAFSPFMIFMAASHMNHVPTLLWVVVAWLAWANLTRHREGLPGWSFLFGFAAALAATIRPVDAAAMTAPAVLLWLLHGRHHDRFVASLVAICAGAAVPILLFLAFNHATTGSAFVLGYEAIWGKSHSLGFHQAPWGAVHSPARGLELLNLYALRLQSYLFETPAPSLIPVLIALALAKRVTRSDQVLLWSMVLLGAAYFAYWHDGFYLGPRFFFVLTPALALLSARAPRALAQATGSDNVRRSAIVGMAVALLIAAATGLPDRARLHAQSLRNSRHQLTSHVDSLGVRDALIFVRESWGSQVLARLWGRRIERPDAELLYRTVDTCVLDSVVSRLEREKISGHEARSRLWPLLADSSLVRASELSPDPTERVGTRDYSRHCLQRVLEDRQGTTLYPLVLAEKRGSNIFARDLSLQNELLTAQYPQRTAYVLMPRAADDSVYVLRLLASPFLTARDAASLTR